MRILTLNLEVGGQIVATFVEPTFKEKANLINMAKSLARLTWTDMTLTACVQHNETDIEVEWRSVIYTHEGKIIKLWELEKEKDHESVSE